MLNKLKEAIKLLKEAEDVLSTYSFSPDGEYNNDDVLDMNEKIRKFLDENGDVD